VPYRLSKLTRYLQDTISPKGASLLESRTANSEPKRRPSE
jgi:hypothetical protein